MTRTAYLVCAFIILTAGSYAQVSAQSKGQPQQSPGAQAGPDKYGLFIVDGGGRPVKTLEAGSTLFVGAKGLLPDTTYEFRMSFNEQGARALREAASFARATTDHA